jgi:hypothetical protein
MFKKLVLSAVLVAFSQSIIAGPDFFGFSSNFTNSHVDELNIKKYDNSVSANNTFFNLEQHGVSLNITAWSSSLGGSSSCFDASGYDQCIQRAELTEYGTSGLGAINDDESDSNYNHAVDNNDFDYDMLLLSFSEQVNLSNLYTGWNYKLYEKRGRIYGSQGQAEASAMALTSNSSSFNPSTPFSSTQTWQDTLQDGWEIVDESFDANGTDKVSIGGGQYYKMPIASTGVFSKYWLVGAANNVSRAFYESGKYDISDNIKIAGVDFMKLGDFTDGGTGTISAPASIGIFALGCAAMVFRRKTK